MIRKLEHERDKLSNQLEKSQEAASHAKKMAKEGEMAIKSATANCTRLENELNRLAQARFWSKSRNLQITIGKKRPTLSLRIGETIELKRPFMVLRLNSEEN